jgi:hypothetical protein
MKSLARWISSWGDRPPHLFFWSDGCFQVDVYVSFLAMKRSELEVAKQAHNPRITTCLFYLYHPQLANFHSVNKQTIKQANKHIYC